MDILEGIRTRHSVGKVKPDPVAREVIEQLLLAGAQAPNHHNVRPWRFVVLTGKARERLGDLFAELLSEAQPDLPPAGLEKERAKPLRAPLLIAVGVDRPEEARVSELENICAAAAACENILLAAHALGMEGIWRSGAQTTNKRVKSFLGLDPGQHLIAFLYLGFPADVAHVDAERQSFVDRTVWME